MNLLSSRELVAELARLGLGTWTADAVRQWIREEVPCPIAEAADRGKPNRFLLIDVLRWMIERERRVKAKGFNVPGKAQLIERLDLALRQFVTGEVPAPHRSQQAVLFDPPAGDVALVASTADVPRLDVAGSSDAELLMEIIQGTLAPETWKRVEDALSARRRRLEAEGKLVPAEDLADTLIAQAVAMRTSLLALTVPLAQRIPDSSTFDQRRMLLLSAFEELLRRLAADKYDHDQLEEMPAGAEQVLHIADHLDCLASDLGDGGAVSPGELAAASRDLRAAIGMAA